MESLFVDSADGTRLRLSRSGEGRDVLIIPGYAEHAGRYAHVAAGLSGYRSTVLELRGHGQSGGKRVCGGVVRQVELRHFPKFILPYRQS